MITLGIIGAGWRCRFFMRIIKAFPDRFDCAGVVVRNAEKRQAFHHEWGVQTYASLAELLDAASVDFVVVSTNENHKVIVEVAKAGIPCLSETPPARSEEELVRVFESVQEYNGQVQIAEQYHLRPHHQAQTQVVESGKIGEVSQAQTSIAHGFHGVSMIRHFLNIGYENVCIRGTTFTSPFIKGPDRAGVPQEESRVDSEQVVAWFHFENNKFGVLDFTSNQYRAWVRNERLLIRGERGEILNTQVHYLKSFNEPMAFDLERVTYGQAGDLKPPGFAGYRGEGEWLYRNPFFHTILMDDEIAMAHCLEKMQHFVQTGESFYSLAEASQDVYLSILYERACQTEKTVESETQIWATH